MILRHQLLAIKPGTQVTFTIMDPKDKTTHDLKVTLEAQPKRANVADRFWNEAPGFRASAKW